MASIFEDCWRGTLTIDRLQAYREVANLDVDAPSGTKQITPLAAACWKGHLNVVRMLLDNPQIAASPDAPSLRGRTPLHFSTSQSPRKNRTAIVRLLIDAGANVDASSKEDGLNTPLMYALTRVKDIEVVRLLVDAGASLDAQNDQGKSAQDLARAQGDRFTRALQGSRGRTPPVVAAIDIVLAVIMFIIAWTNNPALTEYMVQVADEINKRLGPLVVRKPDTIMIPADTALFSDGDAGGELEDHDDEQQKSAKLEDAIDEENAREADGGPGVSTPKEENDDGEANGGSEGDGDDGADGNDQDDESAEESEGEDEDEDEDSEDGPEAVDVLHATEASRLDLLSPFHLSDQRWDLQSELGRSRRL